MGGEGETFLFVGSQGFLAGKEIVAVVALFCLFACCFLFVRSMHDEVAELTFLLCTLG